MRTIPASGRRAGSVCARLLLLLAGGPLACDTPEAWIQDLSIQNGNQLPTRLAENADARVYVSDAQVGSVFIYSSTLSVVQELKNLDQPLAVAVGPQGVIYVGSSGDADGQLDFPVAVAISYANGPGELYVADQGHGRVQVFDLQGNFLRGYGEKIPAFGEDWEGKFVQIQSLAVDALGRLHAADAYMNKVQILDAHTGAYIDSYGAFGTGPGELNVPLDIWITDAGEVVVANSGNARVEVIYEVSGS